MKKMKALLILVMLVSACAGKQVRDAKAPERTLYERANRALADKDFQEASKFYNQLLTDYPATKWLTRSYYNWGMTLEALGKYEEAADKYGRLIDYYQGVHNKEEAEALYRLANCYEELGQDEKLIVTLLQLKGDLQFFGKEVAETEWPSRLAGAYARAEQMEQSQKYYEMAEKGLRKISSSKVAFYWLPKTYYSMGRLPSRRLEFKTINEFNTLLKTVEKSQVWLARAMETRVAPWNQKAADDLLNTYNRIWEFAQNPPVEATKDELIAKKKLQETKKSLAVKLDSLIQEFQKNRNEDVDDPVIVKFVLDVDQLQQKIDTLISQRDVQDQDTAESKKLKGPRIEGKMSH